MATKAEQFKARMQRSGRRQVASPKLMRALKKAGARSSALQRQAQPKTDEVQNLSLRAARKAEVRLEASRSGHPSRKSTRRSANKGKLATNLEQRQIRRTSSPQTRATRALFASRAH